MSDDLTVPVHVLLARLVPLVSQDAQLLALLRELAQEFLTLTEVVAPVPVPAVAEAVAGESAVLEPAVPPAVAPPRHIALPSAPGIEIPVAWFRRLLTDENNLQLIEARCRLKAEGARWAATRQRSIRDGCSFSHEIEPKDREIIDKAKTLENCFLWMTTPPPPSPPTCNAGRTLPAASRRWRWRSAC